MRLKLKTKLIFVVSIVILLLSVVLTTISCVSNYRSSETMLNDFIPRVVNSTAKAIGNQIGDYISTVNAYTQNQVFSAASTDEEKLSALKSIKDEEFHYFGYMDRAGKVLTSNDEVPADQTFYEKSLAGETYFSEPFVDEDDGELLGLASCPVKDGSGQVAGVLFGVFNFSDLCDIVKETSVSVNTSPTIYNTQGTLMAYSDQQLVIDGYNLYTQWLDLLKDDSGVREAYARALGGAQDLEYLNVDGDRIVFGYAPVPYTEWSYNFYVPMKDFLGAFYQSLTIDIVAALVLLILSVGAVYVYGNRLTKPLQSMRDRIILLSHGDLNSSIEVERTKDELEDLSQAMADTIDFLKNCIRDITDKLKAIGNCDLQMEFDMDYQGDFSEIHMAFEKIVNQLHLTFKAIDDTARQVSSGSGQVSESAQALSQGATQQASSTQELAATIASISEQVRENAQNAEQASGKAGDVGQEMMQSNLKMQDMMKAMEDINSGSNEIGKIIKTIEDIAFQTNILALNAAVEAARAGAAGKGFAVVADEVRSLASKSSEASKSTSALIQKSLQSIQNGTQVADETAKSLLVAVDGAKDVISTIDRISKASAEQAKSIEQVTQGIEQIASVVQTNSATAQQSAAASEELSGQAHVLKELVARFHLSEAGGTEYADSYLN